jgi:malonyl CoA-acyl carrier protein transacylase
MKVKDANLSKAKEELEAKVDALQKKLKAINEEIEKNKGKDADRFSKVMEKAVGAIGDLVKGFKDIKSSLVEQKKVEE